MNVLLLGINDKTDELLARATPPFLLIDDGPIADAFIKRYRPRVFDPTKHSFNPLKNITYQRARDFAHIVYTASPQGENTLTVRNGKRALTKAVLVSPRLDKLKTNDDEVAAAIEDILLSPVLKSVLCGVKQFDFNISVVAKIDRARLGDFDSFILGMLLIGQHKGQIIIPDGGFYLRDMHTSLIRQNRLTVGLNYLAELPVKLQQAVLTIKDKVPCGTLFDDADTLAKFTGWKPGDQGYVEYIAGAMK